MKCSKIAALLLLPVLLVYRRMQCKKRHPQRL